MPFFGRELELAAFEEECVSARLAVDGDRSGRRYDSVYGPAGIGKTALGLRMRKACSADTVAAINVPFDDLDESDFIENLGRLRRQLEIAAPELNFPRFDAGYSYAMAQLRPRDFKPKRWRVGPIEPEEMFRRGLEKASQKSIEEILAHMAGVVVSASAGAAVIAGAMAAAFAAIGGAGAYLTVLLAQRYVTGMLDKGRSDALLKRSSNLQALLALGNELRPSDARRLLPLVLAEDLNEGQAAQAATARKLLAFFVDPADPLNDPCDYRAAPHAEGLQRLMGELLQTYVLTFSRDRMEFWEQGFEAITNQGALKDVYVTRHQWLSGLPTADVEAMLCAHATELDLTGTEVGESLARLAREPDGTVSPATVQAYWRLRVER